MRLKEIKIKKGKADCSFFQPIYLSSIANKFAICMGIRMSNEIESRLQKIIDEKEEFVLLKGKFSPDKDIASLGINSLMFIKLIIEIEIEFDIEFDDDDLDMESLNTFGDLIKYIDIHTDDTINE